MREKHSKKCAYEISVQDHIKNGPSSRPQHPCDCDGYHTFTELYEHRIELWIALCYAYHLQGISIWRSKVHSDGTTMDGWFVLGMGVQAGTQITYHLPNSRWDEVYFAEILTQAPPFDGHTSDDVLERLKNL